MVKRSTSKPRKYDYNLVVIGAGSAGLVSAYLATALKARVALIEKHKMGGDCLNTGCVPSKALIRSAKLLAYARRASEFGFRSANFDFDFADIMQRVQRVIKTVEPHDSVERFTRLGVECISGEAFIKSPWEVTVNGKTITTRAIIIATGARPVVPDIPGIKTIQPLTSDNIWELRHLPKRLAVLGGGPIGVELAQCFARFGSEVTIIQRAQTIMNREDPDVAEIISQRLASEGIRLLTGHRATAFKTEDGKKQLVCETLDSQSPRQTHSIEFDEVLIALGRQANVQGFGIEERGIKLTTRGTIKANELLATNYPNIFVCGDVTGPFQFTHMASHQAYYACINALFGPLTRFIPRRFIRRFVEVDYRVVPRVTYTDPEVANVGHTESSAQQAKIAYELTTYNIDDLDRAIADEEAHGKVKVLTQPGTDKIIGATIVGYHASDLIMEFVLAMKQGFGLNAILGTIHPYPTLSEASKFTAGNWKRARNNDRALAFLKKLHRWLRGK